MSNEPKELAPNLDSQIKSYIDNSCQAAITTLFERVKDLLNQQAETQKHWIQTTLNERFSKLEQVSLIDEESNPDNNQPANDIAANYTTLLTVCSPAESREEAPLSNQNSVPTFSNMLVNPVTIGSISNTSNIQSAMMHKARIGYTTTNRS
ncbi:21141_t:CDS:2 [Dentiscutata erythropus]|uniref:21141_t:CDS:1 n=1 Tax=Dentiscutata erythropus TaxID=1348616 RepID=A0A9N8VFF0_9GLOM|nr:21141_t:CDS:2 [Dentiscutata erythropus]